MYICEICIYMCENASLPRYAWTDGHGTTRNALSMQQQFYRTAAVSLSSLCRSLTPCLHPVTTVKLLHPVTGNWKRTEYQRCQVYSSPTAGDKDLIARTTGFRLSSNLSSAISVNALHVKIQDKHHVYM
eukprot:GHVS01097086.1.p2 GENE.GHVS01097086.1~~GHVS01097086.1.p2  ORF type:complete len:129 (-),score=11.53 GHVS01097086.1:124-510(-)